jgi:hypothetical protein
VPVLEAEEVITCRHCGVPKLRKGFSQSRLLSRNFICLDCTNMSDFVGSRNWQKHNAAQKALKAMVAVCKAENKYEPADACRILTFLADEFDGAQAFAKRMYQVIARAEQDGETTCKDLFNMYATILKLMMKAQEVNILGTRNDELNTEQLLQKVQGIVSTIAVEEEPEPMLPAIRLESLDEFGETFDESEPADAE